MEALSNLLALFGSVINPAAILDALLLILHLSTFFYIAIGLTLGMILGSIPGLTSSMGIILLIPLTYGLEPWLALSMLVGIYKGALIADSFCAILLNNLYFI